jgi:ABC-2 type transport system ATP-binding protein
MSNSHKNPAADHEDIVISEITKTFKTGLFKKKTAVEKLSFSVPRGEIVGLLGPNGSGKSTTIKMILGFLKPCFGEILVCGESVADRKARRHIGYLPENPRFQKFLTGLDLLKYYASLLEIPRANVLKRSWELLDRVGLKHAGMERVQGYSKGMCQRLAIAQALLNDPRILIFDEPMSGLDPLGRMEIRKLIAGIHQEMPETTIFFSSHVLEDVEQLCSYVALLQRGKLKTFSPIRDLVREQDQKFDVTVNALPEKLRAKILQGKTEQQTALGVRFTVNGAVELMDDLKLLMECGSEVLNIATHRKRLEEALFRESERLPSAAEVQL